MTYLLTSITDKDIQALVDNELKDEEANRVRRTISYNSEYLKRYHQLQEQKKLIQNWWASE